MSIEVFGYSSIDTGQPTTNTIEIVTQEVELLAFKFIEKNGKRPTYKQIEKWTNELLTAMGWYDDD